MDIKEEAYLSSEDYLSFTKKEDFYEKLEDTGKSTDDDDEDSGLSVYSKKISKKRKKYQKIDNETRMKIVEEVQKNGKLLKNAAEKYNVNYSSAKSIFHVYRKEGRILKKPFKGRVSKTIVHIHNPLVLVNLPGPNLAPQLPATSTETQPFCAAPAWRNNAPAVNSFTIGGGQGHKGMMSTQFVSIVHPKSTSMLHSVCSQPYQGLGLFPNAMNIQERLRSSFLEKKFQTFTKANQEISPSINNFPSFASLATNQQAYFSPESDVLFGSNGSSPTEKSFPKASFENFYYQKSFIQAISSRP